MIYVHRCGCCGSPGIPMWKKTRDREADPKLWICDKCRRSWL